MKKKKNEWIAEKELENNEGKADGRKGKVKEKKGSKIRETSRKKIGDPVKVKVKAKKHPTHKNYMEKEWDNDK